MWGDGNITLVSIHYDSIQTTLHCNVTPCLENKGVLSKELWISGRHWKMNDKITSHIKYTLYTLPNKSAGLVHNDNSGKF